MEEKKNWLREHKKELIIGGTVVVITIIGGIYLAKNWDVIAGKLLAAKSNRTAATTKREPIEVPISGLDDVGLQSEEQTVEVFVPWYLRNLPEGQHASPAKKAQAAAMNIYLPENKTLVSDYSYPKRNAA